MYICIYMGFERLNSENYYHAYTKMDNYLEFLRKRGRKQSSLTSYRSAIKSIITHISNKGGDPTPEHITEQDITDFINGHIATENTIKYYIEVINGWLKHYQNNVIDGMGLLWNTTGTPNARWVREYEFKKILNKATDPTDRLIIILAAYCGLRRAEISNIKINDIQHDKLIIHGKGHGAQGKVRILPISDILRTELKSYLRYRAEILSEYNDQTSDYLIFTMVGRSARHATAETIGRHARDISLSAGIDATTHSLRRYFCTSIYNQSHDIVLTSELMGHQSVKMTAKYIKRTEDEKLQALNRLIIYE